MCGLRNSQEAAFMGCYLCAYQRTEIPDDEQPLPPGSLAAKGEALGTCSTCWVWACAAHGSLYSNFECARCTPGQAITQVTTGGQAGGNLASAALAYAVGRQATTDQRRRMASALQRIAGDQRARPARPRSMLFLASTDGEDNVVHDLARVIRSRDGGDARGMVPRARVDDQTFGQMSLDAVSAAVRSTFSDIDLVGISDEIVDTATGALLLAYSVADDDVRRRRASAEDAWPRSLGSLPPPWQVTHPGLLDPVMWMVGTAYEVAQ
jgi:hypothetical protein